MKAVWIAAALCAGVVSSAARADVTGSAGGGAPVPTIQPSLGVNYLIRTNGMFPSENGSPVGSLGEIIQFAGNFAPDGYAAANGQLLPISQNTALFSLLGTTWGGDGRTTFALPDLRGRTTIGMGQGPGLTDRSLGEFVGVENVTLGASNLPPHAHTLPGGGNTSMTGAGVPYTTMQPSAAINYVVPLEGIYPSRTGGGITDSSPVLGFVYATASSYHPNWARAAGQLLPISQNTALFSLLGTTYGGDGVTTFALPDLRGRAPIGAGTGPGLSPQFLGEIGGTEDSTLTVGQMPSHHHSIDPPGFFTGNTGNNQPQPTMQPTLALHPVIALQGIFPSRAGGGGTIDEPLLGQIGLFAGDFAPGGWAFCDGQILPINQNQALFSLLGTTYGGDGRVTFALPDLRGRIAVDYGQGSGLSDVVLGQQWGVESLMLTGSQLAIHAHEYTAVPEPHAATLALGGIGAIFLRRSRRETHRR
jgi:microcystin-dependent protein